MDRRSVRFTSSAVTFSHLLDLFFLLEGVGTLDVALLCVDDLVRQALRNCLERFHSMLAGSLSNQVDGLVDSSQGRNIDSLLPDHTSCSDTSRVFSWAGLQHGSHEHFKWISASQ